MGCRLNPRYRIGRLNHGRLDHGCVGVYDTREHRFAPWGLSWETWESDVRHAVERLESGNDTYAWNTGIYEGDVDYDL